MIKLIFTLFLGVCLATQSDKRVGGFTKHPHHNKCEIALAAILGQYLGFSDY